MWPLLLRPPVRRSGSSSDFSGSPFVTSAKSETERNRVPGVIGRNCRMPMSALEHGDRVAFFECDDRLLPRRATARPARRETAGTAPGAHHQGAHVGHGDLEQRLDRRADLRLGRGRVHAEGVLFAGLVRGRGLLGDHGADRKSTRLNSSHEWISYAVFCLKKKKKTRKERRNDS